MSAGLVGAAEQFLWSSAAGRLKGGCGQDWPPHGSINSYKLSASGRRWTLTGHSGCVVAWRKAFARSMVDIHSHILPELDDGSRSFEESLEMLEMAAHAGTTDIVASPHSNAEFPFKPELIEEKLTKLQSAVKDRIRLHTGCDFHLSYDNIQDALSHPTKYTINHRCYLLVEFSEASIFQRTVDIFGRLLGAGMVPVITHPERNALLQERTRDLEQWVRDGCLIQVTGQSFLGTFGRSAKSYADMLLERNLVHFVASDAHDTEYRPPRLDESYQYVSRKAGGELAHRIFEELPRRVLEGCPIYLEEYQVTKRKWFKLWG